jgi:hypothetical protein
MFVVRQCDDDGIQVATRENIIEPMYQIGNGELVRKLSAARRVWPVKDRNVSALRGEESRKVCTFDDHSTAEYSDLQSALQESLLRKTHGQGKSQPCAPLFRFQFLPQVSAMSGVHFTKPVSI